MADTKRIVFYSWQSDLPNKTNWGFIQDALERAIKAIHKDDTIEIKPVIDRDTQGVAGSPDISRTIFGKIRQSDIFVCDVSIVGSVPIGNNAFRALPNPNVLVELGFALGILDDSRIIMVANEAFGKVESLPFDLRPRRVVSYSMPVEDEPASARKVLQDKLTRALTTILKELDALPQEEPNKSLAEQAKIAVGTAGTNQGRLIQQYMRDLANKIAELNPKYDYENTPHCEEQLLEAINSSTGLMIEFAQVAEAVTLADTVEPSKILYKGFESILDLYTFPKEHIPPVIYPFEHDLAKFLGHQLFVLFFSLLIREERWEFIGKILENNLYSRESDYSDHHLVPFSKISQQVILLETHRHRLEPRPVSVHANKLRERYTSNEMQKVASLDQFIDADYFLFLRAQVQSQTEKENPLWMPYSTLYMRSIPRYLHEATETPFARSFYFALGNIVAAIATRQRIIENANSLNAAWQEGRPYYIWLNPLAKFDFENLAAVF